MRLATTLIVVVVVTGCSGRNAAPTAPSSSSLAAITPIVRAVTVDRTTVEAGAELGLIASVDDGISHGPLRFVWTVSPAGGTLTSDGSTARWRAPVRKRFEKQGIKILTNAKVIKLDKKSDGVTATIEEGGKSHAITVERVISAVGVVGNIENLGLEKLGVKTDRGIIVVDQFNKTNVFGIYAIGDVSGAPMLAHKAEHEGVVCIEAIKGLKPHPMNKLMIPGCTGRSKVISIEGLVEEAVIA